MKTHALLTRRQRPSKGFTLIEVMISVLIFSFGVLGTVALQARAVQFAEQNGDRSRAALLANEMVSKLWAGQSATPDPTVLANWQSAVSSATSSGLPNGTGTVATSGSTATVTIRWQAPSATAGSAYNSYSTTVVIQ
ncbi:MAG: type IV pilus modification protein PilV [Vitreoscilla sp.]